MLTVSWHFSQSEVKGEEISTAHRKANRASAEARAASDGSALGGAAGSGSVAGSLRRFTALRPDLALGLCRRGSVRSSTLGARPIPVH